MSPYTGAISAMTSQNVLNKIVGDKQYLTLLKAPSLGLDLKPYNFSDYNKRGLSLDGTYLFRLCTLAHKLLELSRYAEVSKTDLYTKPLNIHYGSSHFKMNQNYCVSTACLISDDCFIIGGYDTEGIAISRSTLFLNAPIM